MILCIAQVDVQPAQSASRFEQQTADSLQLAVAQTSIVPAAGCLLPAGQCLVRELLGGSASGCLPDLEGFHLLD